LTPHSHPPIPVPPLSDALYHQVTRFINDRMGLHFPIERRGDLERGLQAAAKAARRHVDDYVAWLMGAPLARPQIEELAGYLTIGETYFFRNPEQFTLLEQTILPELIRLKHDTEKRLRIWCAGCSTGEEPYSVAISLRRVIPDIRDWKITILGTDINGHFMRQAAEACYSEWSFRNAPVWLKDGYFRRHGEGHWKLNSSIRDMVIFEHLNLAEDPYPSLVNNTSAMDIIFCRNVLIYFDAQHARRVASGFYRSLLETGWLLVGPTDTFIYQETEFGPAEEGHITSYRRRTPKIRHPLPEYRPVPYHDESVFHPPAVRHPPPAHPRHPAPVPPHFPPAPDPCKHALDLYHKGRYEEAITFLVEALAKLEGRYQLVDYSARAMSILARLYANLGRLGDSLAWCNQAIAHDKVNPGYHYLQSTIFQERGELNEAREALRKTLFLDQTFIIAQFAIGNMWRAEGRLAEARRHFRNALGLLKRHPRNEVVPESDGLTAGRLEELVSSVLEEMGEAS
jgi:chemotaxis protein methyltransferase CheR